MSAPRKAGKIPGEPVEQQTQQQNANSGEGSASALAAMLKKRRQGENHPDESATEHRTGETAPGE